MAKKKPTKMDKWLVGLTCLTARHGIALAEYWDGSKLRDAKTGKELGRGMLYVCGLYTAHKPPSTKSKKANKSQNARDVHGFASALSNLSRTHGVQLELRSCPMLLVDAQTLEPIARLVVTRDGFAAAELQPA